MGRIHKKVVLVATVVISLILGGNIVVASTWQDLEWVRHITEGELAALRGAAVSGDAESSYKAAEVYGYHTSYSFVDHFFYLRLAAEQGDCRAIAEFESLQESKAISRDFIIRDRVPKSDQCQQ